MNRILSVCKQFVADESGQDLIEYSLVAALISMVAVAALKPLGVAIAGVFTTITTDLTGVV